MEIDDFRGEIMELAPMCAILVGHGWAEDNWFPEFRSDISPVDTAAYGDVNMGAAKMFCYGGINRHHCGFAPHAQVLRTLGDAYTSAGYEINSDATGVRQFRTMEGTTGAVISVVTSENEGFYSGQSHIPFPNTLF